MRSPASLALVAAALVSLATPLRAADLDRGRALYLANCSDCHTDSVHGRAKRDAKDFNAVQRWVTRWSTNLRTSWDAEEIDDVTAYLNATYYRYPCPPTVCKVVSLLQGVAR